MSEQETVVGNDVHLFSTFLLGEAVFGVRAEEVQEIVRPGNITRVHHAPAYVVGIRNLRGRIVTVIDLAMRLELGNVELGLHSRILIIDWQAEPIGLLVDEISDIVAVGEGSIEPSPANIHGVRGKNLRGVCRNNERLVAVLDLSAALSLESN